MASRGARRERIQFLYASLPVRLMLVNRVGGLFVGVVAGLFVGDV